MRAYLGIILLAALVPAAPAAAAGINLSWNDCGVAGVANKTFACNTNSGDAFLLYASFVAPAGLDRLNGCQGEILFDFGSSTVPPWWEVRNTGACRLGSMNMTDVFDGSGVPSPTCFDPWSGQFASGWAWTTGYGAPNRARFQMLGAMNQQTETVVPEGTEAYAFALIINRAKTLGTCSGCDVSACIALTSINLAELTDQKGVVEYHLLTNAALRQHVTWQSDVPNCPSATPAQARTWGAVKAIYR